MMILSRSHLLLLSALGLVLFFPFTGYAASGDCTCTYTTKSASTGVEGSEKTYVLNGSYNSQIINSSPSCQLACSEWSSSQQIKYPGIIYTITKSSYEDPAATSATEETIEAKNDPVIPNLNVDIPNFAGFTTPGYDADGNLEVNFLGQYVDALYRFAIPVMALLAVIMLMIGGLQYILARGRPEAIKQAKDRIKNAVIGLVLLFAAYDIAYLINPDFVAFKSLSIRNVLGEEIPQSEEDPDNQDGGAAGAAPVLEGVIKISGDRLVIATSETYINEDVLEALNAAAEIYFKTTGKNIKVTSASRSLTKQAQLFYDRCLAYGGYCKSAACEPTGSSYGKSSLVKKSGGKFTLTGSLTSVTPSSSTRSQIISALAAAGQPNYCPHTSNVAVDLWPENAPGGYRANVDLMDTLAEVMTSNGFCRLNSEPWHFELEDMKRSVSSCKVTNNSSNYSGGPQAGCLTWDYDDDCCVARDPSMSVASLTTCSN